MCDQSYKPYVSRVGYVPDRIHAASVYCSDGRLGEAFDDFLTHGLHLPRYDRVALPGGPACFAGYAETRLAEQGVMHELKFLVEAHSLDRVILIQHANCAFYGQRLEVSNDKMPQLQMADLIRAAYFIRRHIGVPNIDGFFARVEDGVVSFDPVAID